MGCLFENKVLRCGWRFRISTTREAMCLGFGVHTEGFYGRIDEQIELTLAACREEGRFCAAYSQRRVGSRGSSSEWIV